MLRTPTHIVELGPNKTTTSTAHTYFSKLQKHKQQNTTTTTKKITTATGTNKYHDTSSNGFYQCQLQSAKTTTTATATATSSSKKPKQQQQQMSNAIAAAATTLTRTTTTTTASTKSLLSSTAFSFMRSKKAKTLQTTAEPTTSTTATPTTKLLTTPQTHSQSQSPSPTPSATASVSSATSIKLSTLTAVADDQQKTFPSTTPTATGLVDLVHSCHNNNNSSNNNNNNNNNDNHNNNYKSITKFLANKYCSTEAALDSLKSTATISTSPTTSPPTKRSSTFSIATTTTTLLPLPSTATTPTPTTLSNCNLNKVNLITTTVPAISAGTAIATRPNRTAIASGTSSTASIATATPSLSSMSPTSQTPTRASSLFDSCHRKIRLIGGGPVAFLGGLVAKARRKERDGDQNSTDTKLYLEESVLERKLPEADLKALVDLPAGLDYNEWLASHTLALFEHVNLVYGTISEFCTPSGCTDMTGPGNRTYLWFDEKGKKTRVAAPQYIDYVMTFTQKTVSDESIFPTKYANEFPSSFESIARKILRLQFHVIAHLYAAHFREIALLGLHTHLNLTFAHLTALHRRFNLIDEKETDVLRDLEVALRLTDDSSSTTTTNTNISQSTQHQHNNHHHQLQQQQLGTTADGDQMAPQQNSLINSVGSNNINEHRATTTKSCVGIGGNDDVSSALIDGDANSPPICTQPEPATKTNNGAASVFGGGGGNLTSGILGDLTSSEFGDNNRYYTSAVPSAAAAAANDATAALNINNGAGAIHLNNNNNNNLFNHHPHHHHYGHHSHTHHHNHHTHTHPHQHPHLHPHPHPHPHPQNSGLIQCNAAGIAVNTTTTTAAAAVAAGPATTNVAANVAAAATTNSTTA